MLNASDMPGSRVAPPMPSGISVVIRTFNSAKTLKRVLDDLDQLDGDEVIVVDSGSTDETLAIARSNGARIVSLLQPFHYSKALNAGFREARNPWVLALSSHCIPAHGDLLQTYRTAVAQVPEAVVCIAGKGCLWIDRNAQLEAGKICSPSDFKQGHFVTASNANCLYRKCAWEQHPFDVSIPTAEDIEWSLWAFASGYSIMSIPRALVLYSSSLGFLKMLSKGYNEARVARALVSNPPYSFACLLRRMFWTFISSARGKMPFGAALRNICYLLGDFWGRRSK